MKLYYFSHNVLVNWLHRDARHVGFVIDDPVDGLFKVELLKAADGSNSINLEPITEYIRDTQSWKSAWSFLIGETTCSPQAVFDIMSQWAEEHPDYHVLGHANCRDVFNYATRVMQENGALEVVGVINPDGLHADAARVLEDYIREHGFNTPKIITREVEAAAELVHHAVMRVVYRAEDNRHPGAIVRREDDEVVRAERVRRQLEEERRAFEQGQMDVAYQESWQYRLYVCAENFCSTALASIATGLVYTTAYRCGVQSMVHFGFSQAFAERVSHSIAILVSLMLNAANLLAKSTKDVIWEITLGVLQYLGFSAVGAGLAAGADRLGFEDHSSSAIILGLLMVIGLYYAPTFTVGIAGSMLGRLLGNYLGTMVSDAMLDRLLGKERQLFLSASRGDTSDIKRLLDANPAIINMSQADPRRPNERNKTPVLIAVEMGKLEAVKLFIQRKADLTLQDSLGRSPLRMARLLVVRHPEERIYLDICSAVQAALDRQLFMAAYRGDLRQIHSLLNAGANINSQHVDPRNLSLGGKTPLFIAAEMGREQVVCELLRGGADPCIEDLGGFTPHRVAMHMSNVDVDKAAALERSAVAIQHHMDHLLFLAAFEGDEARVIQCLNAGANLDSQHNDPRNPGLRLKSSLFISSEMGHPGVVRLLRQRGASPAIADAGGWSPYDVALAMHRQNGQERHRHALEALAAG